MFGIVNTNSILLLNIAMCLICKCILCVLDGHMYNTCIPGVSGIYSTYNLSVVIWIDLCAHVHDICFI